MQNRLNLNSVIQNSLHAYFSHIRKIDKVAGTQMYISKDTTLFLKADIPVANIFNL